jgi:hypothetical protein
MNELGLVKAIDSLGQGIVVGIADAADRRLKACGYEPVVYLIEIYWLPRSE